MSYEDGMSRSTHAFQATLD